MIGNGAPSRRSLLALAAAALVPAACAGEDSPASPAAPGTTPPPTTAAAPAPTAASPAALPGAAGLEQAAADSRLGVFAWDCGTGETFGHRSDERFAMCSVFKTLLAGLVLDKEAVQGLGRQVPSGQTLEQLCAAAVSQSDNAAANLLLEEYGGPPAITEYARSLGDRVTRLDRPEPELNEARPGDPRDTTSPAAIAATYASLLLGDALGAAEREKLRGWLVGTTTGADRIRASTPQGWTVGNKTGTGGYGTANDVAIIWPPDREPLVVAVLSTHTKDTFPDDALVAGAAQEALKALG